MSIRSLFAGSPLQARASGRPQRAALEEGPITPFGLFVIVASLLFLTAGILWPQAAGALLRLLLATLALGYVGRAFDALGPIATSAPAGSPFDGDVGAASRVPEGLRIFTVQLGAVEDPEIAARKPIPRQVREMVVAEARRQLAERRGLRLERPADHPGIRALLSEPTWALIRPERTEEEARDDRRPVPLSRLGAILDDLERL